jgi:hypothetical protein
LCPSMLKQAAAVDTFISMFPYFDYFNIIKIQKSVNIIFTLMVEARYKH